MNGKVHTWYMTPEQLADYIKKNPIIPSGKPRIEAFSDVHTFDERKKKTIENQIKKRRANSFMNNVDHEKLHKLFLKGHTIPNIAKLLDMPVSRVHGFIKKQREINPEKWPKRVSRKGG
ncbi:hypothetical protein M670_00172 [Schinkia azotoformans MEV2011]|uniref:Uncharacterized protein n=1 Tax=Schinkia azotoformans MEV2011 TaxID=1348973 RepID=A0A072NRU1_SCHAZ|nr:hypothetical protein [Schinkia azotoformans]KEF40156.1 hypothetical protein M670_00172 [Schinkia azotoformans MEV2011]